jgi:hypothetical protein
MSVVSPPAAPVTPEAPSSAPPVVRRRSAWSLVDQAVSSVASFALGLLVSREAALPEIGAFAIAFSFYQLLLAVGRPLNSDPLAINFSSAKLVDQREPAAIATGGAIALGAAVIPLGVLVALAVGGATGWAIFACALFAPVFLLLDAWRYVFFTRGNPAFAFAGDVAVLVTLVPLAILFMELTGSSGASFVAAWGTAAAIGVIACVTLGPLRPRVQEAMAWWRGMAHLGRHMLGENLLAMGSYLAALSIIAVAVGSDDLGRLRVTQVAFAPANFITLALGTIMLAEGSRVAARAARGVWRLAAAGVGMAAGAAGLLAALWLAVPTETGVKVMGSAWTEAHPLILPVALYFGGIGLTMVLSMALRSLQATREAFLCRAVAAPLTVLAALAGSLAEGPGLAMLGMGIVELCCAGAMLQRLHALRTA